MPPRRKKGVSPKSTEPYLKSRELLCMFKKKIRTSVHDDYQRSPAFTQRSSGAISATMDDSQCFLKRHRTLTRSLWCDGAFSECFCHCYSYVTFIKLRWKVNLWLILPQDLQF